MSLARAQPTHGQPPLRRARARHGKRAVVGSPEDDAHVFAGPLIAAFGLVDDFEPARRARLRRPLLQRHWPIGQNLARRSVWAHGCTPSRCKVPEGMQIGMNATLDRIRFHVTEKGRVLVVPEMLDALVVAPDAADAALVGRPI